MPLFNPFANLGIRYPTIAAPNIRLPGGFGTVNFGTKPPATTPITVPARPVQYAPLPPVTFGTAPAIKIPNGTVIPTTQPPAPPPPAMPLPNQTFNWGAGATGTQFRPSAPMPNNQFNWGYQYTPMPPAPTMEKLTAAPIKTPAKTPVITTKAK